MEKLNLENKISGEEQLKLSKDKKLTREELRDILKESPLYKKLAEEGEEAIEKEIDRILNNR